MPSQLFTPLTLRSVTFHNRIFVSPMCQYSSEDGMPNNWHLVHLGSRAVGGASLVCVEASAVTPEGRITPWDAGIWSANHALAWKTVATFIRDHGAVPAIQLAHAGRKASCNKPWLGGKPLAPSEGAWKTLGPSEIAFGTYPAPRAMTIDDIRRTVQDFRSATLAAIDAGFDVVEVHGAHGYLLHSFCSPLSNLRNDDYGGSLEKRIRLPLEVARAVRETFPRDKPVFYRVSASDWAEGGWDIEQTVVLCKRLKDIGIDLIDASSGGNIHDQKIVLGPGYQVPFAEAIRSGAGIPTAAVGLIAEPTQAEEILFLGRADAVFLARALLRDPYWPHHAAKALGVDVAWPNQYKRADVSPPGR
jgi:2,4-dienoyl-CoA reductase-like NADH-dependent reductase (Old Yellow Enzyme family)